MVAHCWSESMGRPREFDEDQVLECAMHAFWRHGYESTSVADLVVAMNLQKGSIYKAFGDKRALFMRALERYLDKSLDMNKCSLASESSPRAAITRWLHDNIAFVAGNRDGHDGCLALNSAVELAPHDAKVRARLGRQMEKLHALLAERLAEGQRLEEFRADVSPEELARTLMLFQMGVVASMRHSTNESDARAMADSFVNLMG